MMTDKMIAVPSGMKYPSNKLTVVFRDDGPMIHCGDCPTYRSVQITLTDEQVRMLAMRPTYNSGTNQYHEEISRCFIEPGVTPDAEALLREATQPCGCRIGTCESNADRRCRMADEIAEQQARPADEELRRDAERYRWLLKECYRWPINGGLCNEFDQAEPVALWTKREVGDDPCKAIDAAIAAEKREAR